MLAVSSSRLLQAFRVAVSTAATVMGIVGCSSGATESSNPASGQIASGEQRLHYEATPHGDLRGKGTTYSWERVGVEGEWLDLPVGTVVRYGAESVGYVTRTLAGGLFRVRDSYFGFATQDVQGVLERQIETVVPDPEPAPVPAPEPILSWDHVGAEGEWLDLPAGTVVRYGAESVGYVTRTLAGGLFRVRDSYFGFATQDVRGVLERQVVTVSADPPVTPSLPFLVNDPNAAVVLNRTAANGIPVTHGMAFAQGQIPAGEGLVASSQQISVPVQMDQVSRHRDGSVRFAILSYQMPSAWPTAAQVSFSSSSTVYRGSPAAATTLVANGFSAFITVTLGGKTYVADAARALAAATTQTWMAGPEVTEFVVPAPLKDDTGAEHPLLAARFNVRTWAGAKSARVDAIVENNWSYRPGPSSLTYDLAVHVGGAPVFAQPGVIHLQQARWRKSFAWGAQSAVAVRHLPAPLIAAGAIPSYDTTLSIAPSTVQFWANEVNDSLRFGLGGRGSVNAYMPATGGRPDIGALPAWSAVALLTGDAGVRATTLANGYQAGSWPIHYRDERTGKILLIDDFPYASLMWNDNDKWNPATGRNEAFPKCTTTTGGSCYDTYGVRPPEHMPLQADTAHQPSLAYVPYLLTGDQFLFEEVAFWANHVLLSKGPHGRGFAAGLVHWDEVRGQAWSLRAVAQAAFVSPEGSLESKYFSEKLANNLSWYWVNMIGSNPFGYWGVISNVGWDGGRPQPDMSADVRWYTSPWQTDFMIVVTNWIQSMGFVEAKPMHDWLAKFIVSRYSSSPEYGSIYGAPYQIAIEGISAGVYTTWKQMFENTFANTVPWGGIGDLDCAHCYSAIARAALSSVESTGLPNAGIARNFLEQQFASKAAVFAVDPTWALVPRR